MKPWREAIPIPKGINTLCDPVSAKRMVDLMGNPVGKLTQVCGGKERVSLKIRNMIVTRDVGPFRLTGFVPFLDILSEVFAEYKRRHPEMYADLTTAGCLCVRAVRGTTTQPSNHCWGTAVDLGFGGVVDNYGDGKCYAGLLPLYGIAKHHGLYWGAGYKREDAMHFDASAQLVSEWHSRGLF